MTPGFKIEVRPLRKTDDTAAVSEIYAASWRAAYRGLVPAAYLDALTGARWLPKLQNLAHKAGSRCCWPAMRGSRSASAPFVPHGTRAGLAGVKWCRCICCRAIGAKVQVQNCWVLP